MKVASKSYKAFRFIDQIHFVILGILVLLVSCKSLPDSHEVVSRDEQQAAVQRGDPATHLLIIDVENDWDQHPSIAAREALAMGNKGFIEPLARLLESPRLPPACPLTLEEYLMAGEENFTDKCSRAIRIQRNKFKHVYHSLCRAKAFKPVRDHLWSARLRLKAESEISLIGYPSLYMENAIRGEYTCIANDKSEDSYEVLYWFWENIPRFRLELAIVLIQFGKPEFLDHLVNEVMTGGHGSYNAAYALLDHGYQDLLSHIWQEPNLEIVKQIYPVLINFGVSDAIPALQEMLRIEGSRSMAQAFLNSGHSSLTLAAERWAEEQGVPIKTRYVARSDAKWGSSRNK